MASRPTLPPRKAPIKRQEPAKLSEASSVERVSSHPIDVDSPSSATADTATSSANVFQQQQKPSPLGRLNNHASTFKNPTASTSSQQQQQPINPLQFLPFVPLLPAQQQQQNTQQQNPASPLPQQQQQQLIQQQSQQWASMLAAAASNGQGIPGLGNISQLGANQQDIATAIEQVVKLKMESGAAPAANNPLSFPTQQPTAQGRNSNDLLDSDLDEEEGQSWIDLYRNAYFGRADIILAPLLTCVVALLFWAQVMPFWAAFFLVPVLLMGSVHIMLVKGAKMKPMMVPMSRFPCGLVASLEAWALLVFIFQMLPLLTDKLLQCFVMLALAATAFYLHYKCIKSDPGALPTPNAPVTLPMEQRMLLQNLNPAWCWTCNIYKPIRSKHCSICQRCFEEFDHHCPVVANCVAKGNKRLFVYYIATLFAAEVMWMKLAISFHKRVLQWYIFARQHSGSYNTNSNSTATFSNSNRSPDDISIFSVIFNVFSLGAHQPGTTYMTLVTLMIVSGTGYLLLRQLFIIAGNLTTNEWLLRKARYEYLHAPDGTFFNPFDQGVPTNCLQFWKEDDVDWYGIYTQRKGCSPDGPFGAPKWSVTGILRARDRAQEALKQSREERMKMREEWLLRRYGGARGDGGDGGEAPCCGGHHANDAAHQEGVALLSGGGSTNNV